MNAIGPIKVYDEKQCVIGHLYQNRQSKVWTAYNKRPDTVWRKFGPATRKECVAWVEGQKQ